PHIARKGSAAVLLLLVICADANPDRLVCRPIQFALAVCLSVHHLVIRTGANGIEQQPFGIAGLPDSPWGRRIYLPARRNENRQPVVCTETTWSALWPFRLRDSNRTSPGRHLGSLAPSPFWMASYFSYSGLHGARLDCTMVL